MADVRDKLPDNSRGEFYVDSQCIDCDVCRETSPSNFRRNDDNGYSYVYRQPQTDAEIALCKEAFDACPVEAIGDDGVTATTVFTAAA
jgi:ferredoxin